MSRLPPPAHLADDELLAGDAVHVWSIGLDMDPSVAAALAGVLGKAEQAHRASISDPRRRRAFLAVHGTLRVILGAYQASPPVRVVFRAGRWGKPELADGGEPLRFSLSHSSRAVLLAVTGARDVGVDVERGPPGGTAVALAARYFPPSEAGWVLSAAPDRRTETYLRLWTRKEACVKAAGARVAQGLGLPVAGGGDARLVTDPSGRLAAPWLVRDLGVPAGYRAAVAMTGAAPYRVARWRWRSSDLARHLAAGGTLSAIEDVARMLTTRSPI